MSDQKNWDAALIKTWRTDATLFDTFSLFSTLSGKLAKDCDPPLRRVPPERLSWKSGVRYFVAGWLPKISNTLWNQSPSKDIELLRKLEGATYNTSKQMLTDNHLVNVQHKMRKDNEKVNILQHFRDEQNHDTDWNVTKGPSRLTVRRRK